MIINILKIMQNIEKLLNLEGIKIDDIEIFDNETIIKCSSIFKLYVLNEKYPVISIEKCPNIMFGL